MRGTDRQNAEPERCDDLHWHLWGPGDHGHGLLRLLVSFNVGNVRLAWQVLTFLGGLELLEIEKLLRW